ncbi:hypothetical protein FACS1894186_5370 [Alphaproteobacteria bacterium]|nr:hypothetical protein FACS1894186_5370 [Alphaproteobacteria bacterium]
MREIMKNFERQLLGRHWNHKHLPFIATAEHGKSASWHFNILFYGCDFTTGQLRAAINKTLTDMKLEPYILNFQPIGRSPSKLYSYCSKEIKADGRGHFDSARFITSNELFDLRLKPAPVDF